MVVWREDVDVEGAWSAGFVVVVVPEEERGSVVVKDWRAVRAGVWESEARMLGSIEEGVGMVGDKGGRKGVDVGGGRRRDSQVWRSVWRLWVGGD